MRLAHTHAPDLPPKPARYPSRHGIPAARAGALGNTASARRYAKLPTEHHVDLLRSRRVRVRPRASGGAGPPPLLLVGESRGEEPMELRCGLGREGREVPDTTGTVAQQYSLRCAGPLV